MSDLNYIPTAQRPIGVFDSGIGGLTVAAGIAKQFPNESIIYFGDTAHLPYGEKSVSAIQDYAREITRFLLQQNCKMIVIACNSASASAYEILQKEFGKEVLLIDVISPLVEYVAAQSFRKVGVIATKATVSTNIYATQLQDQAPNLEVVSLATGLLAPMIEEGFLNNAISEATIHRYLSYTDFEDIEALLLACTHYPLIRKEIQHYLGTDIQVFDSIKAVRKRLTRLFEQYPLLKNNLPNQAKYDFWVSDYTQTFEQTTQLFYGKSIKLKQISWENELLLTERV